MKIDIKQEMLNGKSEFSIRYDNNEYTGFLPFLKNNNLFSSNDIKKIDLHDLKNNKLVDFTYKYIKNLKESLNPLKILFNRKQILYMYEFNWENNIFKIYVEVDGIFSKKYIMETNENKFYIYAIDDGYISHFPIYYENNQIGEILKSNVIVEGQNICCCYIIDEYKKIVKEISILTLYINDIIHNSSSSDMMTIDSLNKIYSYSRYNKYYNKEWVKNNFGTEFYDKVDNDILVVKDKLKHPFKTNKDKKKN